MGNPVKNNMNAIIHVKYDASGIQEELVSDLVHFASDYLSLPSPAEVSITYVSNSEMAILNERYRGKVGPTDVLSFECDNLDDDFPECETFQAGDIIIAPDVAKKQALELNHSFQEEIETLLVHGLLHLIGYDHIDDADALEMQRLQDELLLAWNQSQEKAEDGK